MICLNRGQKYVAPEDGVGNTGARRERLASAHCELLGRWAPIANRTRARRRSPAIGSRHGAFLIPMPIPHGKETGIVRIPPNSLSVAGHGNNLSHTRNLLELRRGAGQDDESEGRGPP